MLSTLMWTAILLLAAGVCGILDVAGVADSSKTIGQWWPLLVIIWPVTDMLAARRVTLSGTLIAAFGLTLLADAQDWAGDVLTWSALAVFAGVAILADALLERDDRPDGGVERAQNRLRRGARRGRAG